MLGNRLADAITIGCSSLSVPIAHRNSSRRINIGFLYLVLGNGFQKKTQKTPKIEIEKALKIKEEYENEKRK